MIDGLLPYVPVLVSIDGGSLPDPLLRPKGQGMVVVPIFAGYDLRRREGRLFAYDVTGGRYEESNFASTGSGSMHASTVVKLGFREAMSREDTLEIGRAHV